MQSAASVGFSSLENVSTNETVTDDEGISDMETIEDAEEIATDEKTSPDVAEAEDTGISDTDTINDMADDGLMRTSDVNEYGATAQLYNTGQIEPTEATYYDINGNKIEKAEYKKITLKQRIRTSKITEEGYQDNTNLLEDPALMRKKRIERWRSLRKKRIEQWKAFGKKSAE
jgi:hypothetical protein